MYRCGRPDSPTNLNASIVAGGQRFLIEGNDISESGDCIYVQGSSPTRTVIRNNYCHNFDSVGTSEHIDGVQLDGAAGTLSESLIENNRFDTCVDVTGGNDCHVMLFQNGSFPAAENIIVRHNYAHSWASGLGLGSPTPDDEITYMRVYHNTLATEALGTSGGGGILVFEASHNGKFLNNIFYNVTAGASSRSPTLTSGTVTGTLWDSNVVYTAGYSGDWGSPYSGEATYSLFKNINPQFANYPSSAALSSSSTLINTAVPLTTVAVADSGSGVTLIANDARFFQALTTVPGVQADWICVGTVTSCVQISSITYTTNTITLVSGISRNDGDNIWLYKDSDGTQVLYGGTSDIGAYEYSSATPTPTPTPLPDTTPPVISNIAISDIAHNSAIIRWNTNEPSISRIDYGKTTSLGLTVSTLQPLTTHGLGLTNLQRRTTYYYQIVARDSSGNESRSAIANFTTLKNKPASTINLSAKSGSIILTWDNPTDEPYMQGVVILKSGSGFVNTYQSSTEVYRSTSSTINTWTDTNILPGSTYYYSLFVYDDEGLYSDPQFVGFTVPNSTTNPTPTPVPTPTPTPTTASSGGGGGFTPSATPFPVPTPAPVLTINLPSSVPQTTTISRPASSALPRIIKFADNPRVYTVVDGQIKWIPNPTVFNSLGLDWKKIEQKPTAELKNYRRAALLRAKNDPKVYYITEAGKKRWVPTAEVFNSYNNKWQDIIEVEGLELDAISNVKLIRKINDPKVYKLENGQKRWIETYEAFSRNNFKMEEVAPVNQTELNTWPEGEGVK